MVHIAIVPHDHEGVVRPDIPIYAAPACIEALLGLEGFEREMTRSRWCAS